MTASEFTLDLRDEPRRRWQLDAERVHQARELLRSYGQELGVSPLLAAGMSAMVRPHLAPEHWAEIEGIAAGLGVPLHEALLGNLYYDALKFVLGCTAIAVDTPSGPLHARNLDWWTANRMLADFCLLTRFEHAPAGPFVTVGWPGFAGALSGLAPGRFAVTLNAALSDERGQLAAPITFLIRTVLERAASYAEAVELLTETRIACDCLLLVTGIGPGELVVIERTPTRHALRQPEGGVLHVTNEFRLIEVRPGAPRNELQRTSCGRFERMGELLAREQPADFAACFAHLSDPAVKMEITVQQMAFHARSGEFEVRIP